MSDDEDLRKQLWLAQQKLSVINAVALETDAASLDEAIKFIKGLGKLLDTSTAAPESSTLKRALVDTLEVLTVSMEMTQTAVNLRKELTRNPLPEDRAAHAAHVTALIDEALARFRIQFHSRSEKLRTRTRVFGTTRVGHA
ncbi:MAG: hypothetical protein IJ164_00200 [Duodenibacillus sp.]|nr:hypothetical protein [Duodenibacillus sp.]